MNILFIAIPGALAIAFAALVLKNLWSFLTVGPVSSGTDAGPPRLDKLFYFLMTINYGGALVFAAMFPFLASNQKLVSTFLRVALSGWGAGAIALGVMLLVRRQMFVANIRWNATHSTPLVKWFYAQQLRQFTVGPFSVFAPSLGAVFVIAGLAVLIGQAFLPKLITASL